MAPWTIVRANDKYLTRLNVIKDLLNRLNYTDKDEKLVLPDPRVILTYDATYLENGVLES